MFGGGQQQGFGTTTNNGFGAANNNRPQAGGAFGQPAAGGFGGAATTNTFGGGNSAGGMFGAKPATGGFGNAQQTGGMFGNKPAAGGFGATNAGNQFGAQPNAGMGGFGGGFNSQNGMGGGAAAVGTKQVPFQETAQQVMKGNQRERLQMQSISYMPPYRTKSAEELRWEDYSGKSSAAPGGMATGGLMNNAMGGAAAGGMFGGGMAGANTNNMFSNAANGVKPNTGMGFGATAGGGGMFGAAAGGNKPFGAAATGAFGSTQQAGGMFGNKSAAGGFGVTPATGAFGAAPKPGAGMFGATTSTATSGGLFSSTSPNKASGGLFGATGTTNTLGAKSSSFGGLGASSMFSKPTGAAGAGGLFGGNKLATGGSMLGGTSSLMGAGGLTGGMGSSMLGGGLMGGAMGGAFGGAMNAGRGLSGGLGGGLGAGLGAAGGLMGARSNIMPVPQYNNSQQPLGIEEMENNMRIMKTIEKELSLGRAKHLNAASSGLSGAARTRLGKMEHNVSESSRIQPRSIREYSARGPHHDSRTNENVQSLFDPSVKVLSPSNFRRRSKKALVLSDKDDEPLNSARSEGGETKTQVNIERPRLSDTAILGSPSATPAPARKTGASQNFNVLSVDGNARVLENDPAPAIAPQQSLFSAKYDKKSPPFVTNFRPGKDDIGDMSNFRVSSLRYGCSIEWDGTVDLRNLELDNIIHFGEEEIVVYESPDVEEDEKIGLNLLPKEGTGLNKPCTLTMKISCPEDDENYEESLKQSCAENGFTHVKYDSNTGEWKFRVKRF
jgi:hypothetical protein